MRKWSINAEQRMTLTLSDQAAAVIEEENLSLNPKSPSDYFCRIFENYYESSVASIGRTLQQQEEQLYAIMGDHATAPVMKALFKHREEELLAIKNNIEIGDFEDSIRLHNQTKDILLGCEKLEIKYYSRARLYMQAVLEDYFRLSPSQRERIYFADYFSIIETAIAQKRQLKVVVSSDAEFLVHPYKLMTDKLSNSWYLVGYSRRPKDPVSSRRLSTLRVSHLKSVEIKAAQAVITAPEKQELHKSLQTSGVQFLTSQPCLIKVEMSDKGRDAYANMATMRPRYQKRVGNVWEFYCTKMQAMRYFCRLAPYCRIIEPEDLQKDMIKFLKSGAKNYEEK